MTASQINVVGNYTQGSCPIDPTPSTGTRAVPDPLASVQPPTVGPCDHTGTYKPPAGTTLSPGVYCGGIDISGVSVTLSAGTYIMNGGGFTVSGGSASVIGSGVTVYNTFDASHSYKPVTISGGGAVNLSAPTSGAMEGLLFFQDRNVVTSSQDAITGGSATKLEGVLYFPKTQLVYSGGSSGSAKYTTVIAKDLSVTGNSTFNDDYSSLSGGSPIKTVAMVE